MKNKISILILALLLAVGVYMPNVRAEDSATGYGNPPAYGDQQVFVVAYNNNASAMSANNVVILDTGGTAGTTLGTYVNLNGSTTDSVYVFGVTDEAISAATLGRICVRGPHKVVMPSPDVTGIGDVVGACSNSPTTNAGKACTVSTASGTDRGFLGKLINATATTGTSDATNTYWIWVQPGVAN